MLHCFLTVAVSSVPQRRGIDTGKAWSVLVCGVGEWHLMLLEVWLLRTVVRRPVRASRLVACVKDKFVHRAAHQTCGERWTGVGLCHTQTTRFKRVTVQLQGNQHIHSCN
jgi:hypothetical protein